MLVKACSEFCWLKKVGALATQSMGSIRSNPGQGIGLRSGLEPTVSCKSG